MTSQIAFTTLLVPVDFSATSKAAFEQALGLLVGQDAALIALHVIDANLVDLLGVSDLGDPEEIVAGLRKSLDKKLMEFTRVERTDIQVSRVICVGKPFLEIIRKSTDFAVDAIVMGKVGVGNRVEKLLFGSTAERVMRGSARPVIVFPCPTSVRGGGPSASRTDE